MSVADSIASDFYRGLDCAYAPILVDEEKRTIPVIVADGSRTSQRSMVRSYGLVVYELFEGMNRAFFLPKSDETLAFLELWNRAKESCVWKRKALVFQMSTRAGAARYSIDTTVNEFDLENEAVKTLLETPPPGFSWYFAESMRNGSASRTTIDARKYPLALRYKNILLPLWCFYDATEGLKTTFRDLLKRVIDDLKTEHHAFQIPADEQRREMRRSVELFFSRRNCSLENEIERASLNVREAQSAYVSSVRNLTDLQRQLASRSTNSVDKVLDAFLAKVEKYPKIQSVSFEGRTLTLMLKDLVIQNPLLNHKVNLPPYTVSLDVSTGMFSVSTPLALPAPHPHVFTNNSACLGNFSTVFARLVAQERFDQIIDLTIEFLETYNDDSPVPGGRWNIFVPALLQATGQKLQPIVKGEPMLPIKDEDGDDIDLEMEGDEDNE